MTSQVYQYLPYSGQDVAQIDENGREEIKEEEESFESKESEEEEKSVQPQMTKDHAFPSIKIDLVPSLAEDTEPKNERLLPSPESRSSLSEHSEPEVLSDELELPRAPREAQAHH